MILTQYKATLILLLTILTLAGLLFFIHPMPQDPTYNIFADQRTIWGIPNFFNVVSNLALILVGIAGVIALHKPIPTFHDQSERWIYIILFISVGLAGIGSAYYHLAPDNLSLVWDRLPIGLVNVSLVSAVLSDRISHRVGIGFLFPLLALAIFSVIYWHVTDDLRLYAFVLFYPLILIPLLFWLYPTRYTHSYLILEALGWVIIMRICEHFDFAIYTLTYHVMSGHPFKHLSSAFAAYLVLRYTLKRRLKSTGS